MRTLALILALALPAAVQDSHIPQTWYVRPDGGSRYSAFLPTGQCDGKGDAPYPGVGANQHCAYSNISSLWQDGSYTVDASGTSCPAYCWVGAGGDTFMIRGSIGTGVSYRVGWPNNSSAYDPVAGQRWGVQGNPYDSGAPPPPSGTATQHTRILGENFANCSAQSAKTQLHGGFGVSVVLNMGGASNVDVACIDITDFSNCGKATQVSDCTPNNVMQDFATNGIQWSNTSTNDTLTNVRIHGMAGAGMIGPTGDGVEMHYLDILGNASSGWNADAGDGLTGSGSLLVQNFSIIGNGCAEEYPIVDPMPYSDCTDQNGGGYGDGFGTATVVSKPGWNAHFDQGIVAYNTQDGLDALHLIGTGSGMTITRTLAYGNMGQQIKVGGASGTATNNLIVGNCNAMRNPIPGFPAGYNAHLSLFCRAGNAAVYATVGKGTKLTLVHNTMVTAGNVGYEIACDQFAGACDQTALIDYRNNLFVGYPDTAANGDPTGNGSNATEIYQCIADGDCSASESTNSDVFGHGGSLFSNNLTFGGKNPCPAANETSAVCASPLLTDQAWHQYGYGDMSLTATSPAIAAGIAIAGLTGDYAGTAWGTSPDIGALVHASIAPVALPPGTPPAPPTPAPAPPAAPDWKTLLNNLISALQAIAGTIQ